MNQKRYAISRHLQLNIFKQTDLLKILEEYPIVAQMARDVLGETWARPKRDENRRHYYISADNLLTKALLKILNWQN
jgi:hypothetical protein